MTADRPGRNDACPCGSGKKYKKCCQAADDAREAEAERERQASAAARPTIDARSLNPDRHDCNDPTHDHGHGGPGHGHGRPR
jgi:hypothetical protein